MIAHRFKSLGLSVAVGTAALVCYLVTQQVASERAEVEALDRKILLAKLDIRKLETELQTRSRLPTIEGWNREVWGLSAPSASQYLHGEVQLASLRVDDGVARIVQVAALATTRDEPPSASDSKADPNADKAPDVEVAQERPMLRHASYMKPADGVFEPQARQVALLDDGLLADLRQKARHEKRGQSGAQ